MSDLTWSTCYRHSSPRLHPLSNSAPISKSGKHDMPWGGAGIFDREPGSLVNSAKRPASAVYQHLCENRPVCLFSLPTMEYPVSLCPVVDSAPGLRASKGHTGLGVGIAIVLAQTPDMRHNAAADFRFCDSRTGPVPLRLSESNRPRHLTTNRNRSKYGRGPGQKIYI